MVERHLIPLPMRVGPRVGVETRRLLLEDERWDALGPELEDDRSTD